MKHLSIQTDNKKLIKAIKALLDYSETPYTESDSDTKMNKQEFETKIKSALREAEDGKVTRIQNTNELHSFLDSL